MTAVTISSTDVLEYTKQDFLEKVGGEDGLSGFDQRLLRLAAAGKTPDEIARELGIDIAPARVAQRIRDILKTRSWLSILEKKALLVDDMMELKEHLRDIVMSEGGEMYDKNGEAMGWSFGDPRWSANLLKTIKELSTQLDLDLQQTDMAKNELLAGQARIMTSAISIAFNKLMFHIRESYPDVDEQALMSFMEDAIPAAIELVESKVAR